jgi:hypothetical protein
MPRLSEGSDGCQSTRAGGVASLKCLANRVRCDLVVTLLGTASQPIGRNRFKKSA